MKNSISKDIATISELPESVKDTLQRAADLTGATLHQFMVRAAMKEAQEVIDKEHMIHLSAEDADKIFQLIENPPEPNGRLKEAIQRHKVFFSEVD